MADEFQAGICGGNWWNTSRSSLGSSPCSVVLSDMGSFGWSTDMMMDMKQAAKPTTSDDDDDQSASVCDNSMGFQDIIHKPHPVDSGGVLMDSTLEMLGFGLSSSSATSDWNNQTLLHGSDKSESDYSSMMLQEDMTSSRLNYGQDHERSTTVDCHQIQTDWTTSKNFAAIGDEDSTIVTCCQGLPTTSSFPMGSANNSYNYPSSIVQSLFEPDHEPQPQQSVYDYYQSSANSRTRSNDFFPFWSKLSPNFLKPSTPKQQPANHLQFSNNATFWNAASAAPTAVNNDIPTSILSSQHSQFLNPTFDEKPNCANLIAKPNSELHISMAKKSSNEPAFKRPRIETPSPLPTFKVRKEKLGDRITALQQLVSPFGKTDTASVLHEAIEYIKILHDQVSVLSTPYMKIGAHNVQHQQTSHKLKDSEGTKQDLRSRGLCLVPISSTYPMANETTADFWTPTFGGTFR